MHQELHLGVGCEDHELSCPFLSSPFILSWIYYCAVSKSYLHQFCHFGNLKKVITAMNIPKCGVIQVGVCQDA